ncbi:MAG: MarR family transcriptional regulator [Solirubrobacteraceae bacterium]
MLKGEDIVLLLKLATRADGWTVRALSEETTIPKSVVQRSLKRLAEAGLLDERRQRVNLSQAEEFLVHGLRYVFPGQLGGPTRGVAAAWSAEPLSNEIAQADGELPLVWPDPQGEVRGSALEPVHGAVSEAARRDPDLAERLALVDALRVGDARVRGVAARLLCERLDGFAT